VKFVTVMLIAGLSAYAQGHPGGGLSHASGTPGGMTNSGRSMPGAGDHPGNVSMGNAGRRPFDTENISKQSPDKILERNTKLSSRLDGLLPAGTTAEKACSGFKHLGECVSAIHVSHNLGIPFPDLKAKVTGTNPESLGKSIHDLKPDTSAKNEAKKAQKQARNDIEETSDPTS
jgi:hypothetical protein